MKIYYDKALLSKLGVGYLFIDTTSLIAIITHEELFSEFLEVMEQAGRALVTIPSVAFEFTRTDSIKSYNTRVQFIKNRVSVYPIEKHIEAYRQLIPVLQRICKSMSYSDFLLYCCLNHFHNSRLITENHKDFLTSILNREALITIDDGGPTIRSTGIYSFNYINYEKASADILAGK